MQRDLQGDKPWNPTDRTKRKVLRQMGMRADSAGVARMQNELGMSKADAAKRMEVAKMAARARSKEGSRRVNGR